MNKKPERPSGSMVARTLVSDWIAAFDQAVEHVLTCGNVVEPVTGIEPACPAWEAGALPLSYARMP